MQKDAIDHLVMWLVISTFVVFTFFFATLYVFKGTSWGRFPAFPVTALACSAGMLICRPEGKDDKTAFYYFFAALSGLILAGLSRLIFIHEGIIEMCVTISLMFYCLFFIYHVLNFSSYYAEQEGLDRAAISLFVFVEFVMVYTTVLTIVQLGL